MTFRPAELCRLEASGTLAAPGGALPKAEQRRLCAAAVTAGSWLLPDGRPLGEGAVVFWAGQAGLVPGAGAELLWLCLGGSTAALAAGSPGGECIAVPPAAAPAAAALVAQLAGPPPSGSPRESALCYHLLCLFAEARQNQSPLPPLVAEAIEQIRLHYGEVYGIEEVAEALGVSKSHLIRQFTACVGLPPGRYLTRVRVEAAKRLLAGDEHTLETVAGLCGFSGANYLCRVFKRETGVTPAVWRASLQPMPPAEPDEWQDAMYL